MEALDVFLFLQRAGFVNIGPVIPSKKGTFFWSHDPLECEFELVNKIPGKQGVRLHSEELLSWQARCFSLRRQACAGARDQGAIFGSGGQNMR